MSNIVCDFVDMWDRMDGSLTQRMTVREAAIRLFELGLGSQIEILDRLRDGETFSTIGFLYKPVVFERDAASQLSAGELVGGES